MKYVIMVYETENAFRARSDEQHRARYWGAYKAYSQAIKDAGVAAGGHALQPPFSATTVRVTSGARKVQDGPYAETKEQLGGFFVVDVPDLDAALEWASRCPAAAEGAVEVRPVLSM